MTGWIFFKYQTKWIGIVYLKPDLSPWNNSNKVVAKIRDFVDIFSAFALIN
jgi:hypothetical protein